MIQVMLCWRVLTQPAIWWGFPQMYSKDRLWPLPYNFYYIKLFNYFMWWLPHYSLGLQEGWRWYLQCCWLLHFSTVCFLRAEILGHSAVGQMVFVVVWLFQHTTYFYTCLISFLLHDWTWKRRNSNSHNSMCSFCEMGKRGTRTVMCFWQMERNFTSNLVEHEKS